MYKIEWKKSGSNSLNSLFIDGREYNSDCQKFAERCNYLEKLFISAIDDAYKEIFEKWIAEYEAVEELGQSNFDYFIKNGELGFTMEGDKKRFDRWEVFQLKKQILGV